MQEGRPNWNQKLELVAQAAARNPEAIGYNKSEIKDTDKPIKYGSPEYFRIIAGVVIAGNYKRPNFIRRAIRRVTGGVVVGLTKKGLEIASVNLGRKEWKERVNKLLDHPYSVFQQKNAGTIPGTIEKLSQIQEEPLNKQDLDAIANSLREGDQTLQLKFFLDSSRGLFNEIGLNSYSAGRLLYELTKRGLPQLRDSKPEDLTHELLETIDTYSLQDYVNIYRFFEDASEARLFGESYFRRNVDYLARPTPDSISSTPYPVRLKAWEQNQSAYERQKTLVAQALSELKSHSIKERGIFTKEITETLDKNWVMGNLDEVGRIILAVLDHPLTRIISNEEPTRRYTWFSSSYDEPLPNLHSLAQAIKTANQYALQNPSEFSADVLITALEVFQRLTMGLYNLKEDKTSF